MDDTSTGNGRKRKRTKQTLTAPRHVVQKDSSADVNKLVWVLVGKTEHQAWLLEEIGEQETVLVRWESTRYEERVPVLAIRSDLPGRSSRRKQARIVRYDEEFHIIEGLDQRQSMPRRARNRAHQQGPSQSSFVPERKILLEDRLTFNRGKAAAKRKPAGGRIAGGTLSSAKLAASKKRNGAKPARVSAINRIIPDLESLDDMSLVSRFMSILSRLDNRSESSDDDEVQVVESPRLGASALGGFFSLDSHESHRFVTSEAEMSDVVYPLTPTAFSVLATTFYDEIAATLHMYDNE